LITPTGSRIPRKTGFGLLTDALTYAAGAGTGLNFYGSRGEPVLAMPYADLRDRAAAQAGRLRALGLARGDRVALIGETSSDFVTAFFACVWAGLVPVPLPVAGVFTEPARYGMQIARQIEGSGARLLLGPEGPRRLPAGAAVAEMAWAELDALPGDGLAAPADAGPDDLCYLQYSSGSTRFPRGVAVTHRAIMKNCRDIAVDGVGAEPDDQVVPRLPLYHDMGLVGTLLTALSAQVSVDLITTDTFARRPLVWLQLMARNRGTIAYSPCFGYDLCRRRASPTQIAELDLSEWRVAGVGAEQIDPAVMNAFADAFAPAGFSRQSIVASYGLAEATLGVAFAARGDGLRIDRVDSEVLGRHRRAVISNAPGARSFVRCGYPLPSQRLEIRGPEGEALPPRMAGRVFVRGESVMTGYFADPAATADVLDPEGWLDTGDIGYLAEGELVIVGRAKDTIIVNGRNIWPQDLEWIVEQMPQVRAGDCAAFGIREGGQGERPVMLIQCRLRGEAERAALVTAAHGALLQNTGVDCRIVLVPPHTLPRTSSGKLNRSLARERYLDGLDVETALADPLQVAAAR
jgi:fatty-acyl-CoA synthase